MIYVDFNDFCGFLLILVDFFWFLWISGDLCGFLLISVDFWFLLISCGFQRFLPGVHEISKALLTPRIVWFELLLIRMGVALNNVLHNGFNGNPVSEGGCPPSCGLRGPSAPERGLPFDPLRPSAANVWTLCSGHSDYIGAELETTISVSST